STLLTNWLSLLFTGLPNSTRPHLSWGVGNRLLRATAALLNNAGLIVLAGTPTPKGAASVVAPVVLQAADAKSVKSPASIAAVGTFARCPTGSWRVSVPWLLPNE